MNNSFNYSGCSFFADDYPSDSKNSNCLSTLKINGQLGVVDTSCDKMGKGLICRMLTQDSPSCLPGWKLYNGMCYAARIGSLTWSTAKVGCEEEGGRLAYPQTAKDVDYFVQIGALHGCWLGANDIASEGDWETCAKTDYAG